MGKLVETSEEARKNIKQVVNKIEISFRKFGYISVPVSDLGYDDSHAHKVC